MDSSSAQVFEPMSDSGWQRMTGVRVSGDVLRAIHPRVPTKRVTSQDIVSTAAEPAKKKSKKTKNKLKRGDDDDDAAADVVVMRTGEDRRVEVDFEPETQPVAAPISQYLDD